MNKKNIVIFGATGGVGAYTALYLKENGYNVFAVGHRKSDNGFFKDYGIDYYSVNIINKDSFNVLPKDNIYAVIHLAGVLPARMENYYPQKYIDANITGTLNVLEYSRSVNIKKFVFANTLADVYYLCGGTDLISADAISKFPIDSDHSVYTITKNTAVSLIEHYSYKYNFTHFVIRFANIFMYHPDPFFYKNGKKKAKGLYNIIKQAEKGEDIELWGNPQRIRDSFYVKDCTQLIEKCLSSESQGGKFNVGTGIGLSRQKQIEGIIEVFCPNDHKSKIIFRPDLPDSPQFMLDISKNIKELNFKPKYDYISYLEDFKHEKENNTFEKIWGKEEDYI